MYMYFVYQTYYLIIWSKLLTGNQQIVYIVIKIEVTWKSDDGSRY